MTVYNHIKLLLWKNYILQLRHPWVTLFEILIPCTFMAMLVSIRIDVDVTYYKNTTYFEAFGYNIPNWNRIQMNQSIIGVEIPLTYKIYFTPNNDSFEKMMDWMVSGLTNYFVYRERGLTFQHEGFNSEKEMVDYYLRTLDIGFICGIVFDTIDNKKQRFHYKLRFKSSPIYQLGPGLPYNVWNTDKSFPQFSSPGPRLKGYKTGETGYLEEGFLMVQHLVSMTYLKTIENKSNDANIEEYVVRSQRFPYPPYISDPFLEVLQFIFPAILMFSFIYTPTNLTKNLVLEKEKRLKESMKMMGLKEWLHWCAWFLKSVFWQSITVFIITFMVCIELKDGVGILNKSDFTLVFIFFLLYAINTVAFSFLLSTIFSKANIAGVGTGVIFFLTFMPYFTAAQRYLEISLPEKLFYCLLHNTNMAFGAIVISMWEGNNVGIQWSNLNKTATPDDNLTLSMILFMFVFDTFIYLLLTWYISSAFPGQYGIPLKWYFPFTKSYWCPNSIEPHHFDATIDKIINSIDRSVEIQSNSGFFENEPKNLKKGIQIKALSKTFDGGRTFAVKDLSLTTYSGQITVLLGHNGAGKTTTMSMITGLFPPSNGKAIVNGYDIRTEMENIRSSLGICPQFDVLFDELTVEEHLKFFCRLKNVTDSKVVKEEVTKMINLLALQDKRRAQAHTLSGGMKRKLSVGNALIGGSKIVILDEPSSGMDVSARRFIWDLLLELKKDRTILLSTHFMEEADILGDRIAIMANGILQCCGSPLFLKKKYGAGYHLTISKASPGTDVTLITQLIQSHIPNANLDTSRGTERSYSLLNGDTPKFEALFAEIEKRQKELGINSFGASITTLEEVFLKVGEYAEEGIKAINENKNRKSSKSQTSIQMEKTVKKERNSGFNLICQQFYALLMKKFLYSIRNPLLTLSQLMLPLMITILTIVATKFKPKEGDSPALELNLQPFKESRISYFFVTKTQELGDKYGKLIIRPSIGEPINIPDHSDMTAKALEYLDKKSREDISFYNLHRPISAIFEEDRQTPNKKLVTALFNNQAYHTPAISLAFVDNAIINKVLNKNDFKLTVINHPMPRTDEEILLSEQYVSKTQYTIAQNLMFAMSFLAASFSVLLVRERAIKGKHLQMVCGVKLYVFWLASYLMDFAIYMVSCELVMVVYVLSGEEQLESVEQESRIYLIFFIHGLAMLPYVYVLSFMFDTPSTAYVLITLYNIILGIATFLAVFITEMPALGIVSTSKVLNLIFSMFLPNYCLGRAVFNLYNNYIGIKSCTQPKEYPPKSGNKFIMKQICDDPRIDITKPEFNFVRMCCKGKCGDQCFPWEENYFSLDSPGIGQILLWLCFQILFYWTLICLIEYNVFRKIQYLISSIKNLHKKQDIRDKQKTDIMDEDVINEALRLQNTPIDKLVKDNALIIKNLTKKYGTFRAVDNISYGVQKGDCFGLLGINGAGKTTTFKMITGDEPISSGDIYVNGFDVKNDIQQVQRQIGYCPQFDGLLDQLTGSETLALFSRLRGIHEKDIPPLIFEISHLLYFDMHIKKQVGQYSGGTKRKLSTAVALLGSPSVSFLDEPTTGVDPVARRCLWDALSKKLKEGCSIVLTSHSMEECEALCNRLIIMVNGRICCIGSPQHLKNKFGKGYAVQIKVSTAEGKDSDYTQNITGVQTFMSTEFPGSQLKAVHNNLLEYKITDNKLTWSQIFGRIERAKDRVKIEDYSIGQTTLEQIFLSFARKQKEANE